jgi:hypothetical protein
MAASIVTDSEIITPFNDNAYCFSRFNYAASGNTVAVPRSCLSAAVLVGSGTAPTCTVAAGANEDLVTCTGGTLGSGLVLVSRHGSNPAAAR